MATTTTRIKDIPTTATTAASDDYFMVDGATNGTRKYAHNGDPAAHGSVYGALRRKLGRSIKFVPFGDSLCSGNNTTPNTTQNTRGWGNQASILSNGELRIEWNAGVPGDTTTQMLARISTDVLAYTPDICVVMGGRNDINTSVPETTIVNNLDAIASSLLNAGIIPVLCAVPRTSTGDTTSVISLNASIRNICVTRGCIYVDTYSPFINSDGSQKTELFLDGLHFNEAGAVLCGQTIISSIGISGTYGSSFIPFRGYAYGNLITNSNFAGASSGTPGTIPTGWYKSGSPTLLYETDEYGTVWCTLASSNTSDAYLNFTIPGTITGNTRLLLAMRVDGLASPLDGAVSAYLQTYDGATYKISKLWEGVVDGMDGIVQLSTKAIAGNTANVFLVKVKAGYSLRFTAPLVRSL